MYNSIIEVNRQFKSSVNLQFDLKNEIKISQYVPTTDLCDVIKFYIKSALTNDCERSTFLAGPYGKGKSYLILMITYLLGKRENKELFKSVVEKINKIDKELAKLLLKIDKDNFSLLPVVVSNNTSDDFNQNFMLALNNALVDNKLENIIPDSTFTECIKLLDEWEKERDNGKFDILTTCEDNLSINVKKLKSELKVYSKKAYNDFETLFRCVSHGGNFNPLVASDVSQLYSDVCHNLKDYGYNGLFVVFDEFGTFLENQTSDFSVRLNKLQTFAEKCNSSKLDEQMNICCITHKDVLLYNKDKYYYDSFVKISGRFKSIRFDRSLDENYEIIASALNKLENYEEHKEAFKSNNISFINDLKSSMFFNEKQVDYLLDNCYPFNPVSLYSLIQISERIGQNERTMFTFLSDNDVNTFRYFITNNNDGLLNVNSIYDYFENIISENEEYKVEIYYTIESLMKQTLDSFEHEIFKAIAINKIINDDIKYPCTSKNIALALNEDESLIDQVITKLVEKKLIRRNISTGQIDFATIIDKNLNDKIERFVEIKMANYSVAKLLNEIDTNKYSISNKYNFEYQMIRYFRCLYVDYDTFNDISNLNNVLENEYFDGLILNLINVKDDEETIINNFNSKQNFERTILRYNENPLNDELIIKMKTIKACEHLIENEKLSQSEIYSLTSIKDDLHSEIQNYLEDYKNNSIIISKSNEKNLNNIIYDLLTECYNKTIKFNNEQVNKHNISKATLKARNIVVDAILTNTEINEGTSAEATIYQSFKRSLNNLDEINMLTELTEYLVESKNVEINFRDIIETMIDKPYGMRKGSIALYLSYAMSKILIRDEEKFNTIVLYNKGKEIEISAENITKIIESPENFSILNKEIGAECYNFVNELLNKLNIKQSEKFEVNISMIAKYLKRYTQNLEPIIIKSNRKDNLLGLKTEEIAFKNLFLSNDLNSIDAVINELPKIFNCGYSELVQKITKLMKSYSKKISELYNTYTIKLSEVFGESNNDTLKSNYDNWISKYDYADNIIFEDNHKRILNCFRNMKYDKVTSLDSLSFATVNTSVKDWNLQKAESFIEKVRDFVEFVENYVIQESTSKEVVEEIDEDEFTFLGKTLLSNLEEVVDEYGAAVSNEEKTKILKLLINKIIN